MAEKVIPEVPTGDAAKKCLIKCFEKFRYKHMLYEVFRDFCAAAAYAISNSIDKVQFDVREEMYMDIVKRYTPEEMDEIAHMLALLTQALNLYGPQDVLGQVYQELEINNRDRGQFFTPQNISECMGMMMVSDIGDVIAKQGYATVCEPAVGGGSMVFGFCKAMEIMGYDYTTQVHITATDLDLCCVHMAYVQMSLLRIPAVVFHGNTLSMETFSHWVTPMHVANAWQARKDAAA